MYTAKTGSRVPKKIRNSSLQSDYFMLLPIPINIVKHHLTWAWLTWDIGLAFGQPAPIFKKNAVQSAKTQNGQKYDDKKRLDERVKRVVGGQKKAFPLG